MNYCLFTVGAIQVAAANGGELQAVVDLYCRAQLLECLAQDECGQSLRLTEHGRQSLEVSLPLRQSAQVFASCPLPENVDDITVLDLLNCLVEAGWRCRVKPAGHSKCKGHKLAYGVGRPQEWWVKHDSNRVSKFYLLALARAPLS